MASLNEVGISPVLLQAITHTLSSNAISPKLENGRDSRHSIKNGGVDGSPSDSKDRPVLLKKVGKVGGLLHDMNEPVHSLNDAVPNMVAHTLPSGETIIIVQPGDENQGVPNMTRVTLDSLEHGTAPRYIIKESASANPSFNHGGKQNCSYDLNMGQVLTAIASHLKTSQDGAAEPGVVMETVRESLDAVQMPAVTYASVPVMSDGSATSPVNFAVSEIDNDVPDIIVQTSVPDTQVTTFDQPWTKKQRLDGVDVTDDDTVYMVAPASCTVPTGKVVHMMQSKDGEQIYKMVTFEELLEPPHGFMPCPICGDHVSGMFTPNIPFSENINYAFKEENLIDLFITLKIVVDKILCRALSNNISG